MVLSSKETNKQPSVKKQKNRLNIEYIFNRFLNAADTKLESFIRRFITFNYFLIFTKSLKLTYLINSQKDEKRLVLAILSDAKSTESPCP